MRNSVKENISEHSLEVAMIAHALGIIANEKFGKEIDLGKITLMGLYHDANEIITGDMPTPVKYYDEEIQKAYKKVERVASVTLLNSFRINSSPITGKFFWNNPVKKPCGVL